MALSAGTRLGPYEVIAALGAGGMGEVYRARDTRLGREVAVKVLPASFAADADRLRRFELEARTTGMLNHPNILAVYDVGTHEGSPYLVTELLEGATLREELPVPHRKAMDYARQVAAGLAAAHAKGVTHRDLKPENLFVTTDGRVKILDFGLAKVTEDEASSLTRSAGTTPGVALGTAGYMSPEQARGKPADHRSDIFSFGAVLYEMIGGQRAFHHESVIETLNAILKEDPPPLADSNLERIVRRCLEKSPEQRFQSPSDLGFALESASGSTTATINAVAAAQTSQARPLVWIAASAIVLIAIAAAYWLGHRGVSATLPAYRQITFRRGAIDTARFSPDGQSVIYSAAWEGGSLQVYSTRPESPEWRALGLNGGLASVSSTGEMLLSSSPVPKYVVPLDQERRISQVALGGGAPREILRDVRQASFSPDGAKTAIVRSGHGKFQLEYPAGTVLYESSGWIGNPRVSPSGELVAFEDHGLRDDCTGTVAVVDRSGKKRTLSQTYPCVIGLAWTTKGDEVWFTAMSESLAGLLQAVTLSGAERRLMTYPYLVWIHDISQSGRVLLESVNSRVMLRAKPPGDAKEADLSWHDGSFAEDLSPDGKTLLMVEGGSASGTDWAVYLRPTDGSPAVVIGRDKGFASALSPDGSWVMAIPQKAQLTLLPTGPGEPRQLTNDNIHHQRGRWFPDGKKVLFTGSEPGHGLRHYVQDMAGGSPKAVTPEGTDILGVISPDGARIAVQQSEGSIQIYPAGGGNPQSVRGTQPGDLPMQWSDDSQFLYVRHGRLPMQILRVNLATGERKLWKELTPPDLTGVLSVGDAAMTRDGRAYAYSFVRVLSDLYLVDGIK